MPEAFDYVGWMDDVRLPVDDEEREWCACFIVIAESAELAAVWGNAVMRSYGLESGDAFLHSSVEPHVCGVPVEIGEKHPCPNFPVLSRPGNGFHETPVVAYGDPSSIERIFS